MGGETAQKVKPENVKPFLGGLVAVAKAVVAGASIDPTAGGSGRALSHESMDGATTPPKKRKRKRCLRKGLGTLTASAIQSEIVKQAKAALAPLVAAEQPPPTEPAMVGAAASFYLSFQDLYEDSAIVYRGWDNDARYWRVPYKVRGSTVTIGKPVEVRRTYTPLPAK